MKRYLFFTVIVFLVLVADLFGFIDSPSFRAQVQRADLIVEGIVEKQIKRGDWNVSMLGSYIRKNSVKIIAVYKGNIREGSNITVFSDTRSMSDGSRKLSRGKRFLLMLNKYDSGFVDENYGHGIWEIVTEESGDYVVTQYSSSGVYGLSVVQFRKDIDRAMHTSQSSSEEPAISNGHMQKLSAKRVQLHNVTVSKEEAMAQKNIEVLVRGNNEFAFDLYEKFRGGSDNLFFSPYSISTALAMTFAGARGETQMQMSDTLNFKRNPDTIHETFGKLAARLKEGSQDGAYQLDIANAIWAQKGFGFKKSFIETVVNNYAAIAKEADFVNAAEPTRKEINSWVEDKTNDKIQELIAKGILTRDTAMVLVNAIYFKGDWAEQFDKKFTRDADFWTTPDKKIRAKMMYKEHEFDYYDGDDLQAIELPYKGDDLSMVIVLPKEKDGLNDIEKEFAGNFDNVLWELKRQKVRLFLPKFKLTTKFELSDTLAAMGMPLAFSNRADFSGMSESQKLFISNVIHKAFVAVDEEGTEAAAATGVVIGRTSVGPMIPVFRADYPFIFVIRDNASGSILFMGRVYDPAKQGK